MIGSASVAGTVRIMRRLVTGAANKAACVEACTSLTGVASSPLVDDSHSAGVAGAFSAKRSGGGVCGGEGRLDSLNQVVGVASSAARSL
eukprot:1150218-Prymnesium_polylepis.1